jgi:hypothetical protein
MQYASRLIGAVCVLCLCPLSTFARDVRVFSPSVPQNISKSGKANHELFLLGHGMLNSLTCATAAPPTIFLEVPPSHGIVCQRPLDYPVGNVAASNSIHCIGQKTNGVSVIYLPRHGYAGADSLRYQSYGSNLNDAATFIFNIAIVADVPPPSDAVPGDINAPANDTPQLPGLLPVCTALVS